MLPGELELRVFRNIWGRADCEYPFWPDVLGETGNQQGFTLGAALGFWESQSAMTLRLA